MLPREDLWIAASDVLILADVVARWGVTAEDLLHGSGLSTEALTDPKTRVSVPVLERIGMKAVALTGEPGLGFYSGLQMTSLTHGFAGFATMAASTLGEAVEMSVRFCPTRTNAIVLRTLRDGDIASLVVEETGDLGATRAQFLTYLLVGFQHVAEVLTGKTVEGFLDFAMPEPPYAERFQRLVRGEMRFDQAVNQLVFPASELSLPLIMANPAAMRLAREQCERELDELSVGGETAAKVRALMNQPRTEGGFPSLEESARKLGVSARTLKRRLADDGTDFSALLDEQRRQRALVLLRSADLSVEAVADRVGYSDVANFTRAFRRWAGTTPTSYRNALREKKA